MEIFGGKSLIFWYLLFIFFFFFFFSSKKVNFVAFELESSKTSSSDSVLPFVKTYSLIKSFNSSGFADYEIRILYSIVSINFSNVKSFLY